MTNSSGALVQKLYNYCGVLRDDGISTIEYVEQLTPLLFLKMADEQTRPPFNRPPIVPDGRGSGRGLLLAGPEALLLSPAADGPFLAGRAGGLPRPGAAFRS
ncbi:MAG: type I restriction-modification system subunit M N-terminal domain-containing protein, partial [Actinomycetota bacterium]